MPSDIKAYQGSGFTVGLRGFSPGADINFNEFETHQCCQSRELFVFCASH